MQGNFIVPRGVEHMPAATEKAYVLMFKPKSTLNTGNIESIAAIKELERV